MYNLNGTQFYLIELQEKSDGYAYYTVCTYSDTLDLLMNVDSDKYIVGLVELLQGRFEKDYKEFIKKEIDNVS